MDKKASSKKKTLVIGVIALLLAAAAAVIVTLATGGGKAPEPEEVTPVPISAAPTEEITDAPTAAPTEEPTPEPTADAVAKKPIYGMVSAADGLSYALSTAGKLSYMGRTNGRAVCLSWRDIAFVDAGERFTAALTKDGRVLVSDEALSNKVSSWRDITAIACTDSAVYGLTGEGRVLSTDGSANGVANARLIAAASGYFLALCPDGIRSVGASPDVSAINSAVESGAEIIKLAASSTHAVALTSRGEVYSTREGDPLSGVSGVDVFAGENCTAVIDEEGNMVTDCVFLLGQLGSYTGQYDCITLPSKAAYFSCSSSHALVMYADGTVFAAGDNGYMQCETDSWRLRPYLNDKGYIIGLAPGETDSEGELIRTGSALTLPDGTEGTAVIIGDVDSDGAITEKDLSRLNDHLSGRVVLIGAELEAANVLRDAKKPDSVDRADAEQLRYHLNGWTEIDQYRRSFTYSGEVAGAERTNKDTCGYLAMGGTNISAPIMYGDNFYYHYHNAQGAASSNGSIYLYYSYPSQNTVITGHNLRKSGTMLHDLHKIQDRYSGGFSVFKNRVYAINLFGETAYYEVFSMYEEKPSDPSGSSLYYNCNYNYTMESMTEADILLWIARQTSRTQLNYTVECDPTDRFVTLVTCADTHVESNLGGRLFFFLRRVSGN